MNIRQAEMNDLPALTRLLYELFSIEADFTFEEQKQRNGLKQMLTAPDQRTILVAEQADKIIGMVSAQIVISTAQGGPSALIEDMVIDSSHRGKGIGKQLLQKIEAWSRSKHCTRLQLLADKNNSSALAFYDSLGWQTTDLICRRKKT